jgi:defect-in-organelle-trafficking protein DotC
LLVEGDSVLIPTNVQEGVDWLISGYWNKWVAEGWGQGEKQAVDIFLSDLSRLQRDITGMARYRVLLRSGLVEQPRIAFQNQAVQGGRDTLHVGDQVVRITDQPGLQGRRAGAGYGCQ